MENALAVRVENKELTITTEDIKKYIAPKATDKELFMFIGISKSYGLNPFKREIHFVKYGDSPASIIVGYEQYLKRADRTGKLDGWKCWIESDKVGEKAVIEIKRKDQANPIRWEVYRKEFDKNQSTWKAMPTFMLKKVAIAQGFRLAFPDELGGMPYIPEELPGKGTGGTSETLPTDIVDAQIENDVPEPPTSPEPPVSTDGEILDSLKKKLSEMMKGFHKDEKLALFRFTVGDNPTADQLQDFIDNYEDKRLKYMQSKVGKGKQ